MSVTHTYMYVCASVCGSEAAFIGKMFLYVTASFSLEGVFVYVLEGPTENLGPEAEPSL